MRIPVDTEAAEPVRPSPRQIRRAIATSVVANGLEWFDFFAYAYFSKTIAQVFFPSDSAVVSLSLTFGTFALGFVVRPFGGVLLGMYADRVGRARALSFLMIMMVVATLLIGLAPGYSTIGVTAPLLVVLARLLQGLSVGGQYSMTSVILVEMAPAGKKMFYGSFNNVAQSVAGLLSSGGGYLLTTHLPSASLASWGWRVPFLVGALAGPLGLYIRHHVAESPDFQASRRYAGPDRSIAVKFASFLREQGDAVLCAIGVMIIGTASSYVWTSYLPIYVERQLHLPLSSALIGIFIGGVINVVLLPVSGKLADRFGAYRLFYPTAIAAAVCTFPLFWFINTQPSVTRLITGQIIASVLQAMISGPHSGMLTMIFPARTRSTGVALSYNLAVTVFGGMAPLTISLLIHFTGNNQIPAFYVIFAALLSFALVRCTRTGQMATIAEREQRPIGPAGEIDVHRMSIAAEE
jgi:MHS family proline/betaine transporter-like MFS transporter